MTPTGKEDCEFVTGVPCDPVDLDLPPGVAELLPEGAWEYGNALTLFYRHPDQDPDEEPMHHDFGDDVGVWVAGPNVLYIVGDLRVTPRGIVG